MSAPDYDVIKDIPGYKVILKAVLKSQIQQLVEQLATSTDEESVFLTASVADGTLSHLGSQSGKGFLEDHEDIKSQFLGFCLKEHHRKKQEEKEKRKAEALQQSMQTSPVRFGGPSSYGPRSPRFASPRGQNPIHPVALTRASPGAHIRSPGIRHEPYPISRPRMKRTSLNFEQAKSSSSAPSQIPVRSSSATKLDEQVIKIEPEEDEASNQSESDTVNPDKPASTSQSPSHQSNAPSSVKSESGDKDDDAKSESSNSTIPNEPASEGLGIDSDLSNLISGTSQQQTSESSELDPDVSVKLEALTENEMELEITGVEPGRPVMPQDNWDPNVSMGMNFDPTGATGNQGDMTAQGYRFVYYEDRVPDKEIQGETETIPHTVLVSPVQSYVGNILPAQSTGMPTIEQYSLHKTDSGSVYICQFGNCGRAFKGKQKVQRHLLTHTGEKPFACRFCVYKTSRKDQVKVHEFSKHYDEMKTLCS